jgi:hypothetical protein
VKLSELVEGLGLALVAAKGLPAWEPVKRKPYDDPSAGAYGSVFLPKETKPPKGMSRVEYWRTYGKGGRPGGNRERF